MEIVAYFIALSMGISLGLIGSGGSLITLPVFVYLLHINPVVATGYSLFTVGITSAVGAVKNYLSGNVKLNKAIIFAISASLVTFITRRWVMPKIPKVLFSLGNISVERDMLIMIVFAFFAFHAGVRMYKSKPLEQKHSIDHSNKKVTLVLLGVATGLLSGLLGAGGGFLIVPALVLVLGIDIKEAVGTSLFIIALNSFVGFLGDISVGYEIDWKLLFSYTSISVVGIFLGMYLSSYINSKTLKRSFAVFTFIVAFYIIIKELMVYF